MQDGRTERVPPDPHTREVAREARAEVLRALGTDQGYAGYFTVTDIPCPTCEQLGRRTNGGYIPYLRRNERGDLVCMYH
jgi:hypothetical protein